MGLRNGLVILFLAGVAEAVIVETFNEALGDIESFFKVAASERYVLQRGRRQASEMQKVYIGVMNDMKTKFDKRELSSEQKTATTRVISETQARLATHSFRVLGLERGQLTSREVFALLMAHREAGNMTAEQNSAMDNLSEITQIHMVQETGLGDVSNIRQAVCGS